MTPPSHLHAPSLAVDVSSAEIEPAEIEPAEIEPAEIERLAGALALRLAEMAVCQPDSAQRADDIARLLLDELGAVHVMLFTRRPIPRSAKSRSAPERLIIAASHPAGRNSYEGALRTAAHRALDEGRLIESSPNTTADTTADTIAPSDLRIMALPLGMPTATYTLALCWEAHDRQVKRWLQAVLIRLAPTLTLATHSLRVSLTARAPAKTAIATMRQAETPAETAMSLPRVGAEVERVGETPAKTATPLLSSHHVGERAGGRSPAETAMSPSPSASLLALMSHELRTPLNTINGFLEILLDGLAGPLSERQREFLAYAHTSTRRLTQLLEEMVLLSRPEQSHGLLYRVPTDPRGTLASVCASHAEAASARGVLLTCDIAEALPIVCADEGRLSQALGYLLGWAVARTPTNGTVTLRASSSVEGVAIVVEDSGPPLDHAALEQLFQPFRPPPVTEATGATTGLELAVAHRIITLHRGELRASQRPDGGARLLIILPSTEDTTAPASPS